METGKEESRTTHESVAWLLDYSCGSVTIPDGR